MAPAWSLVTALLRLLLLLLLLLLLVPLKSACVCRYAITVWFSRKRKSPNTDASQHPQHSLDQVALQRATPQGTACSSNPNPSRRQGTDTANTAARLYTGHTSEAEPLSNQSEAASDAHTDTYMPQPAHASDRDNQNGAAVPQRQISKPGSIFVSIAAYRDPECQWTMHNLFQQADVPDLVCVGVVWQIDAVEDAAFVRLAGSDRKHRQVLMLR